MCDFIQFDQSKLCGDMLNHISREIKVEGTVYDTIEAYMKCKNDQLKSVKKEHGRSLTIMEIEMKKKWKKNKQEKIR